MDFDRYLVLHPLRAFQREVAAVALVYQRTQIGISVARLIPNREFRAVGKVR